MLKSYARLFRKTLFVSLLVIFVFSLIGIASLPPASAQEAWTPTPTDDVSGQIVGGQPANLGEWPWQVALIPGSAPNFLNAFCGGALIAPQWVLTASHCVEGAVPSDIDVVAGVYDVVSPAAGFQRRDLLQIIMHPNYNSVSGDSDIALLKLGSPITIGGSGETSTRLIALASSSMGDLVGVNAWVTGWGYLSGTGPLADVLYDVNTTIISNTNCNNIYGGITGNMICAGSVNKGACFGDSGGPIVIKIGNKWYLAGLVSFGSQDCTASQVYARVSNFKTWVQSYVPDRQNVYLGCFFQSKHTLTTGQSSRVSHDMNLGPVEVLSSNGVPIIASERVAYNNGSAWTSFSEVMGVPASQLSTRYWFPWYNNIDLDTQIRFANVGNTNTTVTVKVGGTVANYLVRPCESTRKSYSLNAGPVEVYSSGGVPIIASMRVAYNNGSAWTSFSEVMGVPASQVSTKFWFPWYNNIDFDTQIRFANVGTANTCVTIKIGGAAQPAVCLNPRVSDRKSYNLSNGPVEVSSSGGVPIIASIRVAYNNGSAWTSFSEMMGVPAGQVSTKYWFPWYNNVDLNSQIRFANVGTANTCITIKIGGAAQPAVCLNPGASDRKSYNLSNGPVQVFSSGGIPIIASIRIAYNNGSAWTSFSEMMGLPDALKGTSYWFPWYNNIDLDTQLRFAVP